MGLVKTVRRQQSFMRQVLRLRERGEATEAHVAAELEPFREFLVAAGRLDPTVQRELPVPSLLVDLLWHTHMLTPSRYASECARIAGCFIDHDDSPSEDCLEG